MKRTRGEIHVEYKKKKKNTSFESNEDHIMNESAYNQPPYQSTRVENTTPNRSNDYQNSNDDDDSRNLSSSNSSGIHSMIHRSIGWLWNGVWNSLFPSHSSSVLRTDSTENSNNMAENSTIHSPNAISTDHPSNNSRSSDADNCFENQVENGHESILRDETNPNIETTTPLNSTIIEGSRIPAPVEVEDDDNIPLNCYLHLDLRYIFSFGEIPLCKHIRTQCSRVLSDIRKDLGEDPRTYVSGESSTEVWRILTPIRQNDLYMKIKAGIDPILDQNNHCFTLKCHFLFFMRENQPKLVTMTF